jgi:hypothetical protein
VKESERENDRKRGRIGGGGGGLGLLLREEMFVYVLHEKDLEKMKVK